MFRLGPTASRTLTLNSQIGRMRGMPRNHPRTQLEVGDARDLARLWGAPNASHQHHHVTALLRPARLPSRRTNRYGAITARVSARYQGHPRPVLLDLCSQCHVVAGGRISQAKRALDRLAWRSDSGGGALRLGTARGDYLGQAKGIAMGSSRRTAGHDGTSAALLQDP